MKATRQATTRKRTSSRPLVVTVVAPDGKVKRVVRCTSRDDAMEVVEAEAADAPVWSIFLLTREERGSVTPLARWAIGPHGLSRTRYRR